jgi:hypothetical protein
MENSFVQLLERLRFVKEDNFANENTVLTYFKLKFEKKTQNQTGGVISLIDSGVIT